MAADSGKFPAWCLVFVFVLLPVSLAVPSASPQVEGKAQTCASGPYDHDGLTCCLCAAGQHVKTHCTTNGGDPECEFCEPGKTYRNEPNSLESCELCTSCSQGNANLEVEEKCTIAKDTQCRCKEGHYSGTKPNAICQPCQECGSAGVKEACTATNNTVCNDGSTDIGKTVGIVLGVGVGVGVFLVVFFFYWRKKQQNRRRQQGDPKTNKADVEMQLLKDVDLQPFLSDISEVLAWKDMREVARRSGITEGAIDAVQHNNPGDIQEQTVQLLNRFVQMQGKNASRVLIKKLQESGRSGIAEQLKDILSRPNAPA